MNYSTMTDQELDKLAAEMIMNMRNDATAADTHGFELWASIDTGKRLAWPTSDPEIASIDMKWNPTHPDSNQAERYLFPKLLCKSQCETWYEEDRFVIHFDDYSGCCYSYKSTRNLDQINRTKVIACLEVWEKLNV